MSLHKNITYPDGHIVHSYEYANAAARTGATGFVAADIGRIARQTDDNSFYVLTATTPTWASITSGGVTPKSILHWGNNSISGTTTTRYLSPGYDSSMAPTTPVQFAVPCAGTISRLYIKHNAAGGNSNPVVYTVRKNGVATALTVSVNADSTTVTADTTNSFTVAAGDVIGIEVTKASSIGSSPVDVLASVQFVPS